MLPRRLALVLIAVLAGCSRTSAPPVLVPRAVVAKAPAKPVWIARKVVPDAADVVPSTITVGAGETLADIAARSRVPAGAIALANNLGPARNVFAGQSLKLPGGRVHSVKAGETGIAIARAYGVAWERVVASNGLVAPYRLEVGDRLLLPSKQVVAAMSVEERAAAFRIDIEDLITGAEPAASEPQTQKPLPQIAGPAPEFDWPLNGRIVSGFGAKPGGRFNDGINLAAAPGDPVKAAGAGVVAYAGNAVAGFGNLVLIKHADGWISAYGHNASLLVARGARVKQGEVIARAGQSGAVTTPQLHFELRRGRAAVDPVKLLPARGNERG